MRSLDGPDFDVHLMNNFVYVIAAATSTPTTTPGKTSSGSPAIFLVLIILFAGFYFGVMRPNQKRRMQAMRQARAFDLGDEVVAGGMVGRVVRMGDGTVDIEVSDGVIVQFVPNAVQLRSAYMAGPGRAASGRPGARAWALGRRLPVVRAPRLLRPRRAAGGTSAAGWVHLTHGRALPTARRATRAVSPPPAPRTATSAALTWARGTTEGSYRTVGTGSQQ